MLDMCSLRDFPELRDQSLVDKNTSMSVVIKRVKPEVGITVLRFLKIFELVLRMGICVHFFFREFKRSKYMVIEI